MKKGINRKSNNHIIIGNNIVVEISIKFILSNPRFKTLWNLALHSLSSIKNAVLQKKKKKINKMVRHKQKKEKA